MVAEGAGITVVSPFDRAALDDTSSNSRTYSNACKIGNGLSRSFPLFTQRDGMDIVHHGDREPGLLLQQLP
ncbi:hypothetical protein D3C76_1825640 [compost metagenome]